MHEFHPIQFSYPFVCICLVSDCRIWWSSRVMRCVEKPISSSLCWWLRSAIDWTSRCAIRLIRCALWFSCLAGDELLSDSFTYKELENGVLWEVEGKVSSPILLTELIASMCCDLIASV